MTTTGFAPLVDIYEDEHNITLKIEVPGIDEKDIDVHIENNTLTVHGERKIEKEEKEENFRRVERQYGSFTRSFTLPTTVDPEKVSANYDKGILKISFMQMLRSALVRLMPFRRVRGPRRGRGGAVRLPRCGASGRPPRRWRSPSSAG